MHEILALEGEGKGGSEHRILGSFFGNSQILGQVFRDSRIPGIFFEKFPDLSVSLLIIAEI